MLDVNILTQSQSAAHKCRCSGDQVFEGEYVKLFGFVVQRRRARESVRERAKEVHPNCVLLVNQLQQGLAVSGIRVDVMQGKGRRERLRNRLEYMHDQVDVVQVARLGRRPRTRS